MPRKSRWKLKSYDKGVAEIDLFSWGYFGDFIYQRLLDLKSYIYRGHRRTDWKLESTLDRKDKYLPAPARERRVTDHLEHFMYAARGRRGNNPATLVSQNEWWALGQHNGLATPLLDWTTSPYVAAFFAYEKAKHDDTPRRVVLAISQAAIEAKSKELFAAYKGDGGPQSIEFFRPLSDENARLVNQGGLFTRAPVGTDIESWVKTHFAAETKRWILIKLTMPSADRIQCLKELNRMNINYLTLFPDLFGASSHANNVFDIPRY